MNPTHNRCMRREMDKPRSSIMEIKLLPYPLAQEHLT